MGRRHFEQLYADALVTDCRAMINFPVLLQEEFWERRPYDDIMEIGRRLLPLEDQFYADLKNLFAEKRISALMHTPDGQAIKVTDPDVVDFDAPTMPPDMFFGVLTHTEELIAKLRERTRDG